jgi:hypothetical protein
MQSDGVPDADSLKDYAKGFTLFDPLLIALQKEYARQLLGHVNPYSGLTLAADPVVGMVEITNENSLYLLWRNDALKPFASGGILPLRHQKLLDSLWGVYLRQSYAGSDELSASWNAGALSEGQEMMLNGSYDSEPFPGSWSLEQHSPAVAVFTRVVGNTVDGALAAKVTVSVSDGTDWHVQWKQTSLSVDLDSTYIIRFAARADSTRLISVSVMKDVSPYTWHGGGQCTLDTTWHQYSLLVRAVTKSVHDVRLSFSVGAAKGVYWFDAVSMKRTGNTGLLPGESLEQTPRRIGYAECAGFTDGRVRDMTAFYMKLQSDFFATMRSYLKDTLGVVVPIVGTNWNFGTPDLAVQSTMDYVDNHAYWDHPNFPNIPWSAADWTIANTPMVLQPGSGTIGRLMGGAPLLGKPYTISEYNHPFPNRYQSEGPLFLTAYAAFHSVDAICFFDYNGSTDWTTDVVSSYFDMHRNTAQMALMPSIASMFRNGFVHPAAQTLALRFTQNDVRLTPKHDPGGWQSVSLVSALLPLVHGVRTASYAANANNLASLPATGGSPYVSDTGELRWDSSGVFTVGAPGFVGITGLLQNFGGTRSGDLTLVSASDHATMTWIALDGMPLASARTSMLTVATRTQNSGMVWDGTSTIHNNWGAAPTQLYPVQTLLHLHMRADSLRVIPLTVLGGEGQSSRVVLPSDTNMFSLALNQATDRTPWYGIEALGQGASSGVSSTMGMPITFRLDQNYPNPFNGSTVLRYQVPVAGAIRLVVYDVLGREVTTLVDRDMPVGSFSAVWDASHVASGIYVLRLELRSGGDKHTELRKAVLIR